MVGGGIAGAIAGAKVGVHSSSTAEAYQNGHDAGQKAGAEFGRKYGLLILLGSFIIAAGGAISGTLPGTGTKEAVSDKQPQSVKSNSEMDAVLHTQDNNCELAVRNVKIHPSSSGGRCKLKIISTPFSGEIDFLFDASLDEIIKHIEVLYSTLSGEVRINAQHEESYIHFRADRGGLIIVSGLLMSNMPLFQRLEFSFTTDHSALPQFMSDLKRINNSNTVS